MQMALKPLLGISSWCWCRLNSLQERHFEVLLFPGNFLNCSLSRITIMRHWANSNLNSLSISSFSWVNFMVSSFILNWITGSNTFLTTSRLLLTTSIRHGMFNLVLWIFVTPMAPHVILLMSMYIWTFLSSLEVLDSVIGSLLTSG